MKLKNETESIRRNSLDKVEQSIEFLDWIHNNWLLPTTDGYWRVEIEHPEYEVGSFPDDETISDETVYSSDNLYERYLNGEGGL